MNHHSTTAQLSELNRDRQDIDFEQQPPQCPYPPTDRGRHAWCFLFAIFLFEALIWGFPSCFGVFQKHYTSHAPISRNPDGVPAIGTTALGIMYIPAPLFSLALQSYPGARRWCTAAGLAIVTSSLIGASFCDSVTGLIGTQGVLYGIGGTLAYFPGLQLIDGWFVEKREIAFAIVWAGAPLVGVVLPFVMGWALDGYGFITALRIYAVVVVVLLGPAMVFLKDRVPLNDEVEEKDSSFAFLIHRSFWWYFIAVLVQSLGFFLPSIWLPSFAQEQQFPSYAGELGVALLSATAFVGTIIQGWLVHRYHVDVALTLGTSVGATSIFVLWGLANKESVYYLFAVFWGLSVGGYNGTWAGFAVDLKAEGFKPDTIFVISLMASAKGIASVASGPLSQALYGRALVAAGGTSYSGPYGAMIVYTGICTLFGAVSCCRRLSWRRR